MSIEGSPAVRSAAVLGLAASIAAIALSLHFFLLPFRPWPDQGWTLQAALRHARGLGLTTQLNWAPGDLTEVEYSRLTYFPPVYPLIVSLLLRLGMHVGAAVKAVNAAALALGIAGWVGFAKRYLARWPLALFAMLLVASCGALVPTGGTTDYIFWAAMPYWLFAMVRASENVSENRFPVWALLAGSVVAFLIGIRWAAVFLIPSGVLYLLVAGGWRGRNRALVSAAVASAPGVLAYVIFAAINRAASGSKGTVLSYLTPKWEFRNLATTYPFQALSTIPLAVEPILHRSWRAIDPSLSDDAARVAILFGLPALAALVSLRLRRTRFGLSDRATWEMMALVGITAVVLLGLLGFMSVRYNWVGLNWSYLDEPRYFRPIWPAAALFWLAGAQALRSRRVRLAAMAVMAIGGVYLIQGAARAEWRALRSHDESLEVLQFVRGVARCPGLQVVCDNSASDYLLFDDPNLIAILYPDPAAVPGLRASRPATLWMVRRLKEISAYQPDPNFDARHFDAMWARFRPQLVWSSSGGAFVVYRVKI